MKRDFDADTVRELLDELVRRLKGRGIRGTIRVAVGAAMLLRFPDDPDVRVTRDIDALIEPSDEIAEVVAEMAGDLDLPSRWLNAAGRGWLRIEEPRSDEPVTISIASARELAAMKLAAARDKDFADRRDGRGVPIAPETALTPPTRSRRRADGRRATRRPRGDRPAWRAA